MTPDPELLGDDPVRLGDLGTREVLDAAPATPWHPPRWLVVAALLLLVVATAGWFVDRHDRAREARALDGCRHQLQDAVAFSDVRLNAMADYLDPAISVTKGEQRAHIADLMAQPARRTLRGVERADAACRKVAIHPWHVALASRQRATTAYSSALVIRLRDIAAEGRHYYRGTLALQRLREAAEVDSPGGPF